MDHGPCLELSVSLEAGRLLLNIAQPGGVPVVPVEHSNSVLFILSVYFAASSICELCLLCPMLA